MSAAPLEVGHSLPLPHPPVPPSLSDRLVLTISQEILSLKPGLWLCFLLLKAGGIGVASEADSRDEVLRWMLLLARDA